MSNTFAPGPTPNTVQSPDGKVLTAPKASTRLSFLTTRATLVRQQATSNVANDSADCCATTIAAPLEPRLLAHGLYCRKITAWFTECANVEKPTDIVAEPA